MSGGEIAGIIAASAFLVIALAIAVPLVKLGRVMDESANAVREVTTEVVPTISEARQTLTTVNGVASSVEHIVATVTKATDSVAATVSSVSKTVGDLSENLTSSKIFSASKAWPLLKRLMEK